MKKSLKQLLSEGKKYKTGIFVLYHTPWKLYKTGFIARRGAGSAAGRNYSKRIIREYWKLRFKSGNYVFVIKKTALGNKERRIFREKLQNELKKTADLMECKKC